MIVRRNSVPVDSLSWGNLWFEDGRWWWGFAYHTWFIGISSHEA